MAESLHHLHLLVQLQADSFQETLTHHVSMRLLSFINANHFLQNFSISPNLTVKISILPVPFQGWPVDDIGPFEVLMLLCSYEERMKETIDPKKLESGELKL